MKCLVVLLATLGCTAPNPKSCVDDVCSDPTLPFCDINGSLGGGRNECIAVTCSPAEFAECRGDTAIVCNETGDNYVEQPCSRACDAATGCLAVPSNGLAEYLDVVPDPPILIATTAEFDTTTGQVLVEGSAVAVPTFEVEPPEGGVPVRVFVAASVVLGNVQVKGTNGGRALAIVATEDIIVTGTISFTASLIDRYPGSFLSPSDCGGNSASGGIEDMFVLVAAGGGGGFGTAGAAGGAIENIVTENGLQTLQAPGGPVGGTPELVPLRGGCNAYFGGQGGGRGGGAIQLTSLSRVSIEGTIDVRGQNGRSFVSKYDLWQSYVTGGGAGGGILLEAPIVNLGPTARLIAAGGAGASRQNEGTSIDGGPAIGGACNLAACGAGGNGAAPNAEATPGGGIVYGSEEEQTSGGGGGGLGRVRINTDSGEYTKGPFTVEAAVVTVGRFGR